MEYMDDGFESFNGNGTSTSDNEFLSSPDGKLIISDDAKEQSTSRRIEFHFRYRGPSKRSLKKTDSKDSLKAGQQKEKKKYTHSKSKHSSTEDMDSNSDTSGHEDGENINKTLWKNFNTRNWGHGEFTCYRTGTSSVDCMGTTTNSEEECSYSSELDDPFDNNQVEQTHEIPTCIYSSDTGKFNFI